MSLVSRPLCYLGQFWLNLWCPKWLRLQVSVVTVAGWIVELLDCEGHWGPPILLFVHLRGSS